MAYEFNKWFLHEQCHFGVWRQYVHRTVGGEHCAQFGDLHYLANGTFATEAGQAFIPNRSQ